MDEFQKSLAVLTVSKDKVRMPSLTSATVEGKILTMMPNVS